MEVVQKMTFQEGDILLCNFTYQKKAYKKDSVVSEKNEKTRALLGLRKWGRIVSEV